VNDTQSEPTDEELIQRMRRKEEDEASAVNAFTAFYRRHIQFLYRCAANADRRLVGYALGAEDSVEETFTKVWESGADSFTSPEGLDPEVASLRCKRWLSQIARNLVKDKLKSGRNVLPIDPGGENESLFGEPERVETVNRCVGIRQVVTMTLSERDAAIVWFKIRYYDPDTGKSQPPPNAQDAFCKEWDIAPTTLRKAYDRALSAISEAYTVTTRSH